MFEKITLEMIVVSTAVLAGILFFLLLIILKNSFSLSRMKKRILSVGKTIQDMNNHHETLRQTDDMMSHKVTNLLTAVEKLESIETQMDAFDKKIVENHKQLTEHISKLNEHDNILNQLDQMVGEGAGGFSHAIQQIQSVREQVESLTTFKCTFEQIRDQILDALGSVQVNISNPRHRIQEDTMMRETAVFASKNKRTNPEDLYQAEKYRYP